MKRLLFKNIKELVQVRPDHVKMVKGVNMRTVPSIPDAFLLLEDKRILDFGPMSKCPAESGAVIHDVTDQLVLPTWCDSHTHIVYAGDREDEFVDRINGISYQEIARRGGGILHSAERLKKISEADLYRQSAARVKEVLRLGTGAIEIKSGYGLSPDLEIKMLRVIGQLSNHFSLPIKSTLLAAHAIPMEFRKKRSQYLKIITEELIPYVAKNNLAEFVDVFCEKDYFDANDTAQILRAGAKYDLVPKIHVNQFNAIGGIQVAVKHQARSVDHLETMTEADIESLKNTSTMPVVLPGCSFFLGIPFSPARRIIDEGLPLALASDFNPGSAPSGNMNLVVATACIRMRMTPAEAINAATINGAYAMGLENEVGSITRGKRANLLVTKKIRSFNTLAYAFGSQLIDQVFIDGRQWP